jgi:hypothetical protein
MLVCQQEVQIDFELNAKALRGDRINKDAQKNYLLAILNLIQVLKELCQIWYQIKNS